MYSYREYREWDKYKLHLEDIDNKNRIEVVY